MRVESRRGVRAAAAGAVLVLLGQGLAVTGAAAASVDEGTAEWSASSEAVRSAHGSRPGGQVLADPADGGRETTLITGEFLRMQSVGDRSQMRNLAPRQPVTWDVEVWAEAPDPGVIRLGITGAGELAETPGAMTVSVHECSEPWSEGGCSTGAEELLRAESLDRIADAEPMMPLTTMPSDEERWLRVEVVLGGTQSGAAAGVKGEVRIHAWGAGEKISSSSTTPSAVDASPGGHDGLARTGAAGVAALLASALMIVALGAVLRRGGARQ